MVIFFFSENRFEIRFDHEMKSNRCSQSGSFLFRMKSFFFLRIFDGQMDDPIPVAWCNDLLSSRNICHAGKNRISISFRTKIRRFDRENGNWYSLINGQTTERYLAVVCFRIPTLFVRIKYRSIVPRFRGRRGGGTIFVFELVGNRTCTSVCSRIFPTLSPLLPYPSKSFLESRQPLLLLLLLSLLHVSARSVKKRLPLNK